MPKLTTMTVLVGGLLFTDHGHRRYKKNVQFTEQNGRII